MRSDEAPDSVEFRPGVIIEHHDIVSHGIVAVCDVVAVSTIPGGVVVEGVSGRYRLPLGMNWDLAEAVRDSLSRMLDDHRAEVNDAE